MNEFITIRFEQYQQLLIQSAAIARFSILKQTVTQRDGRIRVRALLNDGGLLEFAEYIAITEAQQTAAPTYTFHWQNAQGQLVRRWDNVNHFPRLAYAPHHIHQADEMVVGNPHLPTLETVLAEIEKILG